MQFGTPASCSLANCLTGTWSLQHGDGGKLVALFCSRTKAAVLDSVAPWTRTQREAAPTGGTTSMRPCLCIRWTRPVARDDSHKHPATSASDPRLDTAIDPCHTMFDFKRTLLDMGPQQTCFDRLRCL